MPDNRVNLQINQPHIEGNEVNDKNGWPTPLSDPSSPLKMTVTKGSNGSQKNFDPVSTSVQSQLSLAEGNPGSAVTAAAQGSHTEKLKTSQMNPPNHSIPEGQ